MTTVKRRGLAFIVLVTIAVSAALSRGVSAVGQAPGGHVAVVRVALPAPLAGFSQVVEAVAPAVVNVNSVTRLSGRTPVEEFFGDELLKRFFGEAPEGQQVQRSLGSGVIVDPTGIVLTNAHVVERATDIEVATADGKKHKAKVVGADRKTDLPSSGCRAAAPTRPRTWMVPRSSA